MSWIVYALSTAVLWGAVYPVYGRLVKFVSVPTVIAIESLVVGIFFFVYAYLNKNIETDFEVIKSNHSLIKYIIFITIMTGIANFAICTGLTLKNATAVSLIEITYPLFTAFFAWLFFNRNHLTVGLLIGGILIMFGVACIVYFESKIGA